uniref:Transposase n=1 Tax=Steinernema glaseri TaxID=37863 RepID=A0A1I7YLU0_9BILA
MVIGRRDWDKVGVTKAVLVDDDRFDCRSSRAYHTVMEGLGYGRDKPEQRWSTPHGYQTHRKPNGYEGRDWKTERITKAVLVDAALLPKQSGLSHRKLRGGRGEGVASEHYVKGHGMDPKRGLELGISSLKTLVRTLHAGTHHRVLLASLPISRRFEVSRFTLLAGGPTTTFEQLRDAVGLLAHGTVAGNPVQHWLQRLL